MLPYRKIGKPSAAARSQTRDYLAASLKKRNDYFFHAFMSFFNRPCRRDQAEALRFLLRQTQIGLANPGMKFRVLRVEAISFLLAL